MCLSDFASHDISLELYSIPNYSELFEGDEGIIREAPSMETIHSIVMAAPHVVPVEDHEESSALEYAILSNAEHKIVKYLMHVTKTMLSRKSSSNNLASNAAQVPNVPKDVRCITPASSVTGPDDRTAVTI